MHKSLIINKCCLLLVCFQSLNFDTKTSFLFSPNIKTLAAIYFRSALQHQKNDFCNTTKTTKIVFVWKRNGQKQPSSSNQTTKKSQNQRHNTEKFLFTLFTVQRMYNEKRLGEKMTSHRYQLKGYTCFTMELKIK